MKLEKQAALKGKTLALGKRLKGSGVLRIVLTPFMGVQHTLSDWTYRRSEDAEYLNSLRNTHLGETCFVIGNGPSLRTEDLDAIGDTPCFASNRIYKMFDRTLWRPTYYVLTDREIIAEDAAFLAGMDLPTILLNRPLMFGGVLEGKSNIHFINEHPARFTRRRFDMRKVTFSRRPDLYVGMGYSVTFASIQLAMFMGFSDIVLIGIDHTYASVIDSKGRVVTNRSVKDHCFEERADTTVNPSFNPQFREGVEYAYWLAKYEADSRGVKILNATRGGALEIFERVDLDKVLEEIADGK